ncbi:hypothetical protein Poli38472_013408 [Pythium oligandrum]|uniref:Uncharacterized protein n=1 Tax=Pythium oligandrum TaxID=41045 RepID=A0A8K1C7L7_PYTOL|nr:hypothetical protein Poli38472_013408 [Pythium oligandrum]|eukprot:TMW57934.1 hypothetical protein Poli38472_013408 [Pythium oligandrum]
MADDSECNSALYIEVDVPKLDLLDTYPRSDTLTVSPVFADIDWTQTREAFELVAMLAVVHADALARGISEDGMPFLSGLGNSGVEYRPSNIQQPIRLVFELRYDRFDAHFYECMFQPLKLSERSDAYQKARQRLLDTVESERVRRLCENVVVPVQVRHDEDTFHSLLRKQESALTHQRMLVLEGLHSSFDVWASDSDGLCGSLEQPVVPIIGLDLCNVACYGSLVRSWLKSLTDTNMNNARLSMDTTFFSLPDTIAMFSSIAATRSLESFDTFVPGFSNTNNGHKLGPALRSWLQWMAFALFSVYSRSAVKEVELKFSWITQEVVAVMQEVLEATNPLQVLLGSSEPECRVAMLLRDVDVAGVTVETGTDIWIVRDDHSIDTVEVHVPGHGVCTIGRSDMTIPTACSATTRRFVLKLSVYELIESDGLFAFIKLLGPSLSGLSLSAGDDEHTRHIGPLELESLVRACPHIKSFELHKEIKFRGCDQLWKLYESGECHMAVLVLPIHCEDELRSLLTGLAQSESRMAQCVRRLDINLEYSFSSLARTTQVALKTMHETNRIMETVQFDTDGDNESIKQTLLAVPPVRIALPRTPPIATKLAFLSGCYMTQLASSSAIHAMKRMDRGIFGTIFAFAAMSGPRLIIIDREGI